jgi:hypothetical protein
MADEERTCPCDAEDDEMTMAGALHVELNHLFNDLWQAMQHRINTDWSIRCENLAWRIQLLSRLAGPLHWDHITVSLLRDGTYARVYEGVEYPPIDWERVAKTEARIEAQRARY